MNTFSLDFITIVLMLFFLTKLTTINGLTAEELIERMQKIDKNEFEIQLLDIIVETVSWENQFQAKDYEKIAMHITQIEVDEDNPLTADKSNQIQGMIYKKMSQVAEEEIMKTKEKQDVAEEHKNEAYRWHLYYLTPSSPWGLHSSRTDYDHWTAKYKKYEKDFKKAREENIQAKSKYQQAKEFLFVSTILTAIKEASTESAVDNILTMFYRIKPNFIHNKTFGTTEYLKIKTKEVEDAVKKKKTQLEWYNHAEVEFIECIASGCTFDSNFKNSKPDKGVIIKKTDEVYVIEIYPNKSANIESNGRHFNLDKKDFELFQTKESEVKWKLIKNSK